MNRTILSYVALAALAMPAYSQIDIDLDYMADRLQFAEVPETRLAWVESGKGVPVVLLHGAFSDYRYWAAQLHAGSGMYRMIAYSRRDFYPNRAETRSETQTEFRDVLDLIEFIEDLEIAPVHLVGHSAGGHIALIAAIRRPDLVRSGVLEEGGFVADHPVSSQALAEIAPVIMDYMQLRSMEQREAAITRFIDFVSGDGFYSSAPLSARRLMLDNERAYGIRPIAPLNCTEAASLQTPVLVILGELSPDYTGRLLTGIRDCLPNEETVTIPGASHGIHYEQPAAFNEAVFGFISGY